MPIEWSRFPSRPWHVIPAGTDPGSVIVRQGGGTVGFASTFFGEGEQQAINNLWAAAPELYDALTDLLTHGWPEETGCPCLACVAASTAKAALKKAEGAS